MDEEEKDKTIEIGKEDISNGLGLGIISLYEKAWSRL